jgi:hypothetical protein
VDHHERKAVAKYRQEAWTNPEKRRASSAEAMQISTAIVGGVHGALRNERLTRLTRP